MNTQTTTFSPFYYPSSEGEILSFPRKTIISLFFGVLYTVLQYAAMPEKSGFFSQYCWVLGTIISTSLLALYIATDVFRRCIATINEMQGNDQLSSHIIKTWLCNSRYVLAGTFWGTINMAVAHLLGIPGEVHSTPLSLSLMYGGYFASGFASGMGVLAIFSVIVLYLKLAANLQHSLDPDDPDGRGGIKELGDSLWFFAMLITAVGALISLYLFSVDWQFMHLAYVRWVFLAWISQPYLIAISIVLVPGLAVRRQVTYYKRYRSEQLKKEKSALYASYKEFENSDDESIVIRKKEIASRLIEIQEQMENLKKMRSSHIDGSIPD